MFNEKKNTTISLQTVSGCIVNKTKEQFCVANILLDTGSGHFDVAFLNKKKSNMKSNELEVVALSLRTDERKAITMLEIPEICTT